MKRFWAMMFVMVVAATAVAQEESTLPLAPSFTKAAYIRSNQTLSYRSLPDASSEHALTKQEKFELYTDEARSPLTFVSAGVTAGSNTASNRLYGRGWGGFGRNYAAAVAEQQTSTFLGRYLFPTLLSQDPRYHPSEKDGFFPRSTYAATRVLITRTDSGRKTINSSYLLGALVSTAISACYRPYHQTAGQTFMDFGSNVGSDAGMNILKEFWPSLRSKLRPMAPKKLREFGSKIAGQEKPVGLVDLNKN